MSDFEKKIKQKLQNHEEPYSHGAWEQFKKRLPLPWYISWGKTLLPWMVTIASLSLWFFTDEKEIIQQVEHVKLDTVFVQKWDTLTLIKTVVKPVYLAADYTASPLQEQEQVFAALHHLDKPRDTINEGSQEPKHELANEALNSESVAIERPVLPKPDKDSVIVKDETDAPPSKKKMQWPSMRFGVNLDAIGFGLLTAGPSAEVFIDKKWSVSAGLLFSGQQEIKHGLEKDFNSRTGKRFYEAYGRFLPNRPNGIKDISIKTSFIKLPLAINYYVPTWKKLGIMATIGTKLDVGVYQDVDFLSSEVNEQISRRFEAKVKPKVFNNLFYATGIQYSYQKVSAQLMPYFEYRFRSPEYFLPARNIGLSTAVRIAF